MSGPTKVAILEALIRVLDAQDAHRTARAVERGARAATDEAIVVAIRKSEDTWARIHAFFPESQWAGMREKLDRLERSGAIHWCVDRYREGPKLKWTAEGGYVPAYSRDKTGL